LASRTAWRGVESLFANIPEGTWMDQPADDLRALQAAAFLIEALELGGDVEASALAPDLIPLETSPTVATFAVELESSVGPAAFLVYVYSMDARDDDGRSGHDRFTADLATIERAAELGTPGPRAVASAQGEDVAYILATTPATLRALQGEPDPTEDEGLEAGISDLLPVGEVAAIRAESPPELLRLLREANEEAKRWLAAIRSSSRLAENAENGGDPALLELTEAERELALYLLDERSVQSLLEALNLLLSVARGRTDRLGIPS
jgi:hypothetical protein